MMYALSLNPCVDKSARVPAFQWDAPNRIRVERVDLGGKGVNVARVYRALGGGGALVSFDYRGGPVAAAMRNEGVPGHFLPLDADVRINLKLTDDAAGHTIEINEQGAAVTEEDLGRMEHTLLSLCRAGDWAALSGSLPPGAPTETYGRLCRLLRERGCRVAVDCDGEALRRAIPEKPALIKPNAQEFEALTGADPQDERAAAAACGRLLDAGVGAVCLSRGAQGAILATERGAWRCPAGNVAVQGPQGAGDSMLAALMLALERGMEEPDALRFASAAAGASVMRPGTLLCHRADVERLLAALPPARACF